MANDPDEVKEQFEEAIDDAYMDAINAAAEQDDPAEAAEAIEKVNNTRGGLLAKAKRKATIVEGKVDYRYPAAGAGVLLGTGPSAYLYRNEPRQVQSPLQRRSVQAGIGAGLLSGVYAAREIDRYGGIDGPLTALAASWSASALTSVLAIAARDRGVL